MGPQMVVYNGCNTAQKSNLSPFFFFSQEQTTERNLRKRERTGEDNETTATEATLPCNTVVRQSYMHDCSKHALVTFRARTKWSVPLKRRANSLQHTFAAELCIGETCLQLSPSRHLSSRRWKCARDASLRTTISRLLKQRYPQISTAKRRRTEPFQRGNPYNWYARFRLQMFIKGSTSI